MKSLSDTVEAKVLLIDDDPLIRDSMQMFLTSRGIDLTCCRKLEEGFEALSKNRYDILLCDQCFLSGDGERAFEIIKDSMPGMVRALFTDSVRIEALSEAQRLGVDLFIAKPFTAESIADAIGRVAERVRGVGNETSAVQSKRLQEEHFDP
jgi:phosphoserine phosphatase RsbU/P